MKCTFNGKLKFMIQGINYARSDLCIENMYFLYPNKMLLHSLRDYGRRGSAALTTRHHSIRESWH
jgi:hypothetical protein